MKRLVNRISFIRLLGALLALGLGGQLWALPPAPRQLQGRGSVSGEVLVKVTAGPTSDAAREAHQQVGATVLTTYTRIGWQRVQLPAGMTVEQGIAAYQVNPDVAFAEPNYIYRINAVPNDPMYSQLWGMEKISAPAAWNITTGSNTVVVADIDTGVDYTHPDLAANMWTNPGEIPGNDIDDDDNGYVDDVYGIDTVNDDSDPMDDEGHGTHTSGTIGAVGNNKVGVVGVNWSVKIMALKFLDEEGFGETADAIECFEYVQTMKSRGINIHATNNSWSGGGFSQALMEAIDSCGYLGIVNVCSAGNNEFDNDILPTFPASYPSDSIIAVAASDADDARAYFSNWGADSVDLAAPGLSILSTLPGGQYGIASGTSMAAPHVTGAVALLCALHSELTAEQVKEQILRSVDPVQWTNTPTVTNGRLNLERTIHFYRVTFVSPPPGAVVYVARPTLVIMATGLNMSTLQIKVDGVVVGTPTVDTMTGELIYRLGPLTPEHVYRVSVAGKDRYGGDIEESTTFSLRTKYLLPGKYMIALPATDIGTVTSVFADITYPRIGVWNPSMLKYQLYPQSFSELTASTWAATDRITQEKLPPSGRGFWVDLPTTTALNMPGDILRHDRQYTVPVLYGFNMIGNPYTFPVGFGTIMIEYNGVSYSLPDAVNAELIEPVLYWWEGTGYRFDLLPDAVLAPWVGYWILCRANTRMHPMNLIFQPATAGLPRSATPLRAQREVWEVTVHATGLATAQKATVTLGALAGATNQKDFGLDIAAPPAAPDGISLTSRSGLGSESLLRDYRPLADGATYRWEVTVSGSPGSQIVLSWPKLTGLPKDYLLTLHDQVTGTDRYLRTSANYTVTLGAQETERQLIITATPGAIGTLRVVGLQAQRTRANGGAVITCQVTQTANVTVEIRTLSGRLLRRFPAATSAQGLVTATWDGVDSRGRRVPRGAYLCHVLAETATGQKAAAVAILPF